MTHAIPVPIDLLPPLLQDFERLVGLKATMALVKVYGGLRVYFPTVDRAQADHPYAALIGLDNLLKLSQEYGGQQHFQLPKAERALLAVRNARIAADYQVRAAQGGYLPKIDLLGGYGRESSDNTSTRAASVLKSMPCSANTCATATGWVM